jgi:hypothetical protein
VKKLVIAATIAAFGAAVALPTAAVIGSNGAYAAQKAAEKTPKKKPTKKYHKKKKAPSQT